MSELIELTGKKFGRLMVIEKIGYDSHKHVTWLCRCECGAKKIIAGKNLRRGHTKSCGCLNTETVIMMNKKRALSPGFANMRQLMKSYKASAKRRGLEFNLTEEQFAEITQQDCYYCGAKPNNIGKQRGLNGIYIYNGLDRIDNNKGYIIDNVIPCCHQCNSAKGKLTLQEYKNWIKRIYNKIITGKGGEKTDD